ncbi:MAG: PAS domain-containing protein, partial [Pseudomonadota bacterium]
RQITSYVSHVNWDTQTDDLALAEGKRRQSDDLRNIVAALNTSRARLQNSLKQTDSLNLRMEAVLNAATSGIIGFDAAGTVTTINPQAQHILGILEEELPCQWPGSIEFLDLENASKLDASNNPIERALAGQEGDKEREEERERVKGLRQCSLKVLGQGRSRPLTFDVKILHFAYNVYCS